MIVTFDDVALPDAEVALLLRGVGLDADDHAARRRQIRGVRVGRPHPRAVADDVAGVAQALICNTQCEH